MERVEPELDAHDLQILRFMALYCEMSPKNVDQPRRLNRLEAEGYVEAVRHDPPGLDASPAWVYRLTVKGQRIIERKERAASAAGGR